MTRMISFGLFVLLVAIPGVAQPLAIAHGDVFAVVSMEFPFADQPLRQLQLFGGDGSLKQLLEYEPGFPMVTNRSGHFFALQSGGIVEEENAERDAILRTTIFREANNVALTVDDFNGLYVLGATGTLYLDLGLGRFRSAVLLPGIYAPVTTASIDLSSDRCTLFYTDGYPGGIHRYDLCRSKAFAVIAPQNRYQNVRALADGGVVASRDGSLDFYDADGRLMLTGLYVNSFSITAMAFDVDPAYIWLAAGPVLMKTGIRDRQPVTWVGVRALGITVPGETRPNTPAVMPSRPRAVRH